jgi:hypothetical protein
MHGGRLLSHTELLFSVPLGEYFVIVFFTRGGSVNHNSIW